MNRDRRWWALFTCCVTWHANEVWFSLFTEKAFNFRRAFLASNFFCVSIKAILIIIFYSESDKNAFSTFCAKCLSVEWSDFIHEFLIYIFAIKIFLIRTKKNWKQKSHQNNFASLQLFLLICDNVSWNFNPKNHWLLSTHFCVAPSVISSLNKSKITRSVVGWWFRYLLMIKSTINYGRGL